MLDLYGGCGQDEQLPRRPPLTQLPSEVSVPAQFAHTHESCPIASMWGAGLQTNDALLVGCKTFCWIWPQIVIFSGPETKKVQNARSQQAPLYKAECIGSIILWFSPSSGV